MQFYTIVALFAASALAAPTVDLKQARGLLDDVENGAKDVGNAVEGAVSNNSTGCSLVKCAAALGPAAVGCGAAAAQAFADPISDAACLAAALNDVTNKPAQCDGCNSSSLKV